jgi:hypothetical protein
LSNEKPTTSPSSGSGGSPAASAVVPCPVTAVTEVHARLQLKSVTFSGGSDIDNDTFGDFPTPHFLVGRAADASPRVQRPAQFPYAITRATKLSAVAVFTVTQQPTTSESVTIDAEAVVAGTALQFHGSVTVNSSDTEVTTPSFMSDVNLPNTILKVDPLTIDWFQTPCDVARHPAGSSTNTLYITLDTPTKSPLHWTLLEVSCAAASAETTVTGLRTKSYAALQTRDIKRKRDNHDLTYWNPQTTTAHNTQLLLAAADGSGQCGSWAEFLVDMWKSHGDNGGHKVGIASSIDDWLNSRNMSLFLVKNWRFDPPHPANPFTFHYEFLVKCFETAGVPGQNSPNPPPHFLNHFIVIAGGKFYDPSYGSPAFSTKLEWENASIDGLGDGNYGAGKHGGYRKSDLSTTLLLEFIDLVTLTRL